jgi:N-acetylglucosamine-6-phosphate deacetylase
MGISGRKGALSRGKDADVLILDEKLKVRCVWQMGRIIENSLFQ